MKKEDYYNKEIQCYRCCKTIDVKADGGLVKLNYDLVSRLRTESVTRFYHLICFKELNIND